MEYEFNISKNDLVADHMLFTGMYPNLLTMYMHFQILNGIHEKYSVRDFIHIP
ncbi:hypothetical protein ACNF42_03380 [Cuniculiplasma sp. SKW3]|uniref:hypothetical protein n=1 Tax=Cuniculiplasma sp. SKW3 TaxID=3400170 RepID=UPI003FD24F62